MIGAQFTEELLLLTEEDIRSVLIGRDTEILELVRRTYELHAKGECKAPRSAFLHISSERQERAIALPALVGGDLPLCGLKWVASYPNNVNHGGNRASALVILNSLDTGYPTCVLEGAWISSLRTAAGAVLAARALYGREVRCLGLIGAGRINFEVMRILRVVTPDLAEVLVCDEARASMDRFAAAAARLDLNVRINDAPDAAAVLRNCGLISIATSATAPHIHSLDGLHRDAVILHLSLRDLVPKVLIECANYVDDPDHALSEGTSLALAVAYKRADQLVSGTLASLLSQRQQRPANRVAVFSPFGMGILDIAVAGFVEREARIRGLGTRAPHFTKAPWYA